MDKRFLIAPGSFVAAIAANYVVYPTNIMKLCHLFGAALNFGMTAYSTCIVGLVISKTVSRQQFVAVQSKLFPIYFTLQTICTLGVAFIMSRYRNENIEYQKANVYATAILTLIQFLLIEPKVNKTMIPYLKLKKEQGEDSTSDEYKKAKGKFFMYHGISSLINLISFVLQSLHIYWLSSKLSI